jgi:hypothetical protein
MTVAGGKELLLGLYACGLRLSIVAGRIDLLEKI